MIVTRRARTSIIFLIFLLMSLLALIHHINAQDETTYDSHHNDANVVDDDNGIRNDDANVIDLDDEILEENTTVKQTDDDDDDDDDNVTKIEVDEKFLNDEEEDDIKKSTIHVKSNLESLTDEELRTICIERGFDIADDDGNIVLTHDDYVEAAIRCLSLEDEMNAIIAKNPELAAELEIEIERMRKEKERLLHERDTMLKEIQSLQEQLRQSGITDPVVKTTYDDDNNKDSSVKPTILSTRGGVSSSVQLTWDETLRESFVLLFDRVGQDCRIAGKIIRMTLLKPLSRGTDIMWRYMGPSIEQFIMQIVRVTKGLLEVEKVSKVNQIVTKQLQNGLILLQRQGLPLIQKSWIVIQKQLEKLNQIEQVHIAALVVGSILGPLRDSLRMGWNNIKPDLIKTKDRLQTWAKRINEQAATVETE